MTRLTLPALAALLFAAAASAQPAKDAAMRVETTLAPGKIEEACVHLAKGESRRYHWKASGPVDFNIHYHRGNDVFYPVKRDGMRGDGGAFTAKSAEEYCWMWTAKKREVKVEAEIR